MMFAYPAIILRASVCFSSEARITVLNVQIWPSCVSALTIVLNIILETFVSIWRLFSSTKADIMGGYIIAVTLCYN